MGPGWLKHYVGLPFEERGRGAQGFDCWGLIRAIYEKQLNIELPSYAEDYRTTTDEQEIGALVRQESASSWKEVSLEEARLGDVLVIRMRNMPMHCALIVERPWFLHIERGINSVLERCDSVKWAKRIVAVYRYQGAA